MLAPRKKLWSSPDVAVEAAITLLAPTPEDVVYDVGCGDGRFLVACALRAGCRCVGLEIDEARAREARAKAAEAGVSHLVTIKVGNALEMDMEEATAMFLYLVPRGLRIMLPRLVASPTQRRVATYMAGFEGEEAVAVLKVTPPHQPDAKWPVFLFELGGGSGGGESGGGQIESRGGESQGQSGGESESASGQSSGSGNSSAGKGKEAAAPNPRGAPVRWALGAILVAVVTLAVHRRRAGAAQPGGSR